MDLAQIITPRHAVREQAQHELYLQFMHLCADEQASTEMIAGACINALITVCHRMHMNVGDAEMRWDNLFGQGKELLKQRFNKKIVM
jgi:hypothetical protein